MFKPGTDENNVQMSDVLCDFCHREWTDELPLLEGHRGRMICGNCLSIAYQLLANERSSNAEAGYTCTLCREGPEDRAALDRTEERGWASPATGAAVCARCVRQAAGALHKDPDFPWSKPPRVAPS
ncbi:MAG: hypothetical protein HKO59_14365 [Phycisphaerales bacterium]|nr:hypothetical protein [Phycisphaerae bacterium]NNF44208.1 hypothetical protein [Phycisphaerales bacterium]NNM27144.1 hypothetical protein [Phycisphaerales bacterium]